MSLLGEIHEQPDAAARFRVVRPGTEVVEQTISTE